MFYDNSLVRSNRDLRNNTSQVMDLALQGKTVDDLIKIGDLTEDTYITDMRIIVQNVSEPITIDLGFVDYTGVDPVLVPIATGLVLAASGTHFKVPMPLSGVYAPDGIPETDPVNGGINVGPGFVGLAVQLKTDVSADGVWADAKLAIGTISV